MYGLIIDFLYDCKLIKLLNFLELNVCIVWFIKFKKRKNINIKM